MNNQFDLVVNSDAATACRRYLLGASRRLKIYAEQTIDVSQFDNSEQLESRILDVPKKEQGALRTALLYLYFSNGPTNIPRDRLKLAERHLGTAERIVIRWLFTRTSGRLKKHYGPSSLQAARAAQYRCVSCGFADVRVLNLDSVHGRKSNLDEFVCLCANCHTIKSRVNDWELPTPA